MDAGIETPCPMTTRSAAAMASRPSGGLGRPGCRQNSPDRSTKPKAILDSPSTCFPSSNSASG